MDKAFLFNQSVSIHGKAKTGLTTFLCANGSSIVIDLNERPIKNRAVGHDDSQAAQFYEDISSVEKSSSSELTISFSDGSKFSLDMSVISRKKKL